MNKTSTVFPFHHLAAFILFVVGFGLIVAYPNSISSDQNSIIFDFSVYPGFSDGIVTFSVIGLYNKFIHPAYDVMNTHFRLLAFILYFGSAYLLANSVLKRRLYILLFLVILFTSRFPFLWLSRELITGAFICLTVTAFMKRWNPLVTCFLIVLMAHTKPELSVVSLAFLGLLMVQNVDFKKGKGLQLGLMLLAIFGAVNFLILVPELLSKKNIDASKRPFFSFGQHYGDLVDAHQLFPTGDGFSNSGLYLEKVFPGAQNVGDIIRHYPKKYYDFVWLSIGHGVKRLCVLFHVFLIFILIIYWSILKGYFKIDLFYRLFFWSLLGAVPFVLVSYPHIRYFARYYPLAVLAIFYFLENCRDKKVISFSQYVLAFGILLNVLMFFKSLGALSSGNYWFPD